MPTDPRHVLPEALRGRPYAPELEIAIDAALDAGRIQRDRLGRLERIVHKSAKDVVTEADHASEEAILSLVRAAFPTDHVLAEESGHSSAATGSAPTDGSAASHPVDPGHRIWIVDPLDGTVNYANAIPFFCVSIALAVGGRPVVAVVLDPVRGDLYTAIAGEGAYRDGHRVHQPHKERMEDTVCHLALPKRGFAARESAIVKAVRVTRVLGSAALALSYAADGRFDSYVQYRGLSLWDIAAAGLIAEEAGVRVTDPAGAPWFDLSMASRSIGIVAAGPAHHARLIELLA
jgi:myo-inositol-1(or 4)-monophosphatase